MKAGNEKVMRRHETHGQETHREIIEGRHPFTEEEIGT